jgi:hypothetical protein
MKEIPTLRRLMPRKTFTVRQLQDAVAALSVRYVHKASFRRVLREYAAVVGTGEYAQTGRGRPAELVSWNPALSPAEQQAVAYRLAQWMVVR